MGDPLYNGDIDLTVIAIMAIKVLVTFGFLLVSVMLMTWFERKVISDMQHRIGPNRAGPFGILQPLADGVKLFMKEDLIPDRADRLVFQMAPVMLMAPSFLIFSIIPIGGVFSGGETGTVEIFGRETYLQLANPPVGVLLFLAMSAMAVYGVMLAGWASGSKYSLLGSVRASAQVVSYEAALGLSLAAIVLVTGTLSTTDMVAVQAGEGFAGIVPRWNIIVTGFVPFVIFLIAGTAELNRPPFDLAEAEQELVAGFATEYSSIRFALFQLAEFMNTITMSALIVTLFLGGPAGPVIIGPGWLWGIIWFFSKLFIFLFMFVWFRGTLPRLRYDQLMDLGWKRLIPLALGWLLVLACIRVAQDRFWNVAPILIVAMAIGVLAAVLLAISIKSGQRAQAEMRDEDQRRAAIRLENARREAGVG